MDKTQNPYLMPGAIVVAGLVVAAAVLFKAPSSDTPNIPNGEPQVVAEEDIDLEGWPSLGSEDAPVTIVEYADFACPYCKQFFDQTKPAIMENYIDTGLVRFVYKDFAVVGGEFAAEAAHCAAEQNAYWPYYEKLFERQTEDRATWQDVSVHRGYAVDLGLDANALASCFESRRYEEKVTRSTEEAIQNGGRGTPHFIVNGVPVEGAQPFSVFKTVIDIALDE